MKRNFLAKAAFGLICLSMTPSLVSLPQGMDVASGSVASSNPNPQTMVIEAGDRAIINYDSFSVGAGENVRFVQPSADATVLNRVQGAEASEILGKMEGNGRVFLVNPNGVYFGRDSKVNMGSFIASTLDIANQDFSEGRYNFALADGSDAGIDNKGSIRANGSVVFMGASIRNSGKVVADVGSVVAAAGKQVILDFVGNGLVNFAVDGELERAVIEQVGAMESPNGQVHLAMGSVAEAIENVINTDGVAFGGEIVEENGVILLVESTSIKASVISVSAKEGSSVTVAGTLDASSTENVGGQVHVFGENISLDNATIDASGALGGGEVLVGGDLQGEGSNFNATNVSIGEDVLITADALTSGAGGEVIVWSDEVSTFNGQIFARGGAFGGNGGFVETSGGRVLTVKTGNVNTTAAEGLTGTWFMDPETIVITSVGTDSLIGADDKYDFTSQLTISPDIINNATSNVVLSAMARGGSITVDENTSLVVPAGYEIKFDVDQSSGQIVLKNNASVATEGGMITFNGPVLIDGDYVEVLATVGGASADINFNSTVNGTVFDADMLIDAGPDGQVNILNTIGGSKPVGAVDIHGGDIFLGANVTTQGKDINIFGGTTLVGNSTLDTTVGGLYNGGDITFNGTDSTVDGPYKLTLETGSGIAYMEGSVGDLHPLESLKITGALTVLSQDMTTDGNTMVYLSPVTLTADITLTDNGTSGIFFLDTVNGDGNGPWTLTANAPIGEVSFVGAVGGTNALKGLVVTANEISQSASVTLGYSVLGDNTLTMTYSAPGGIQVSGDISSTNGKAVITMNNPVLFVVDPGNGETPDTDGAVTVTASSGDDEATNPASVSVNGVASGSGNLIIKTGDSGDGTSGSVALTNASVNLVSLSVTSDSITQDANSAIFATGDITLNASAGANVETLTTLASISTTDGTITIQGGETTCSVASNLNAGTGNIILTPDTIAMTYSGNMKTEGGTVTVNSPGLSLGGNSIINVGDGSVSLNAVDGASTLTISGSDVGEATFAAAVGASTAPTGLEVGIGKITQGSTVAVDGPVSYICPLGVILNGASIATTTAAGTTRIIGPVTLGANFAVTAAGSGADILFSGETTTIASPTTAYTLTLTPQSDGIVTFGGAIGTGDPLASINVAEGAQLNIASNITVNGAAGFVSAPPVVLTGASTISATNGSGVVTFSDTLNGTQPLNIQAGGAVTFTGAVGGINYLAGLNVVGSGITISGGSVNVVGGASIFNGAVTLGAATTVTNNGSGATFLSTIAGASNSLTVNSPTGIAHFAGAVSAVSAITADALAVEVLGAVDPDSNGAITISGSNRILLAADLTATGTGAITISDPTSLGTSITLTSATGAVTMNGVVEGSGGLTISSGAAINLQGAPYSLSSLSATSSAAAVTQAAASPIATIGDLTLVGQAGTSTDSVITNASLSSSGGNIAITATDGQNNLTSNIEASGGNVTITNTEAAQTTTYNGGTISTGNGNLTVAGAFVLSTGAASVNVGSGTATFSSTVIGAQELSVNGTAIGSLVLNGAVGATALTSLVAEIGNITQGNTVATTGEVTYSAVSGISLGGNVTTTNASTGTIKIIGPTTLTAGVTFTTANPNILFEGSTSTINGAQTLAFSSGSGNIRLDGAIGFNTAVSSITTTSTGTTLVGADITTNGTQVYGGAIVLTGDCAMNSTNNNITFSSTINGNQKLLVNAGTASATYSGVVGAVTPLQSLDTIAGSGISLSSNVTAR